MALHGHASKKVPLQLSLSEAELAWLEAMAAKHSLPDKDKVFRIVLTYVRDAELDSIFEKKGLLSGGNAVQAELTVEEFHVKMLEAAVSKFSLQSISEAAALAIAYASSEGNEVEIFGVIRCKDGPNCSACAK